MAVLPPQSLEPKNGRPGGCGVSELRRRSSEQSKWRRLQWIAARKRIRDLTHQRPVAEDGIRISNVVERRSSKRVGKAQC